MPVKRKAQSTRRTDLWRETVTLSEIDAQVAKSAFRARWLKRDNDDDRAAIEAKLQSANLSGPQLADVRIAVRLLLEEALEAEAYDATLSAWERAAVVLGGDDL